MLALAQDDIALDRGATAPGLERTCALTRDVKPVSELIRFVVGPDGALVPDVKRKLPGRGLWLTGTRDSVEEAVKRNVFARGFKREIKGASDLAETVDRLLERAALDALSVAGKAGLVAAGFAKVEAALEKGGARAVLHAADGSAEGRRKLKVEEGGRIVVVDVFPGAQLDLALNRPNVVHAALLAGPGSETFLVRVARLLRYRTNNSQDRDADRRRIARA